MPDFIQRTALRGALTIPYAVYLPPGHATTRAWPLILFLHGAGESGHDGVAPTKVGIGPALRKFPDRYPAIVILPQCPAGSHWYGHVAELALHAADDVTREYNGDGDRLYLTGISMGGFGSFWLASEHSDRLAAVVPVCGGGDASMAGVLADLPMWVFHGGADNVVPVEHSQRMVEAIRAAGGRNVRYTEYPRVGHNSWDSAYAEQEMTAWLFEQRREESAGRTATGERSQQA